MTSHHGWANTKRTMYLHQEAMKRRKGSQKAGAQAKADAADRAKQVDAGATADVEAQFGDQRNALSSLLRDAPNRMATINETYDRVGSRLEDIAKGRAQGAMAMMGKVGADMALARSLGGALDAAADRRVADTGGQVVQSNDAAQLAGQQQASEAFQAQMAQLGVNDAYGTAGVNELARGEEVAGQRQRDAAMGQQMRDLIKQMAIAKEGAKATRYQGFATSDAAQATASAAHEKNVVSQQAAANAQQTKKVVSAMIALEKFGLLEGISAEKGSPQRTNPNIMAGILNMAGIGGPDRVRGSKLRNPPARPHAAKPKKPKGKAKPKK